MRRKLIAFLIANKLLFGGLVLAATVTISGVDVLIPGPQGPTGPQGPPGSIAFLNSTSISAAIPQKLDTNRFVTYSTNHSKSQTTVTHQAGDYTAAMVGADPAGTATSAIAALQSSYSFSNIPSNMQYSALAGSYGTPGSGNKYVTDQDTRNSNARTPVSHASTHTSGGSDPVFVATSQVNGLDSQLAGKQSALSNAATLTKISESGNLPLWNGTAWPGGGSSGGDMYKATYDPQGKNSDAFARANHTGTQAASTITGLATSATTDTTTTANITDSTNKRFITDAQRNVLTNTSNANSGDVTLGTSNGLSLSGQTLSLAMATNSVAGALSATDHVNFASGASLAATAVQPAALTSYAQKATTLAGYGITDGETATHAAATYTNASNISSGTLDRARLPALVSGDIPNNAANTTGTAAGLSANITESQVTGLVSDLSGKLASTAQAADSAKLGGTSAATVVAGAAAGATALQPTGSGAGLTGITAAQVGAVPVASLDISVLDFGAKGDAKLSKDGVTNGSTAFTSASAGFTPGDAGKMIIIVGAGAGGANLQTTIIAVVSATSITLNTAAVSSATGVEFAYGTDDSAAFIAAANTGSISPTFGSPWILQAAHKRVHIAVPSRLYMIASSVTYTQKDDIVWDGYGTILFNGDSTNAFTPTSVSRNEWVHLKGDAFLHDRSSAPSGGTFVNLTTDGAHWNKTNTVRNCDVYRVAGFVKAQLNMGFETNIIDNKHVETYNVPGTTAIDLGTTDNIVSGNVVNGFEAGTHIRAGGLIYKGNHTWETQGSGAASNYSTVFYGLILDAGRAEINGNMFDHATNANILVTNGAITAGQVKIKNNSFLRTATSANQNFIQLVASVSTALSNFEISGNDGNATQNLSTPAVSLTNVTRGSGIIGPNYWIGVANTDWHTAVPAFGGSTSTFLRNDGTYATPPGTSYTFTSSSVVNSSGNLALSADSATPGNTMLYGTNGSGAKGWYAQPTGSGVTLQTNGTNNGSQSALNLIAGSNVTLSNSGSGVTINTSGSSMVYPNAGVPNSTGSAWGASYTAGTSPGNLALFDANGWLGIGETATDPITILTDSFTTTPTNGAIFVEGSRNKEKIFVTTYQNGSTGSVPSFAFRLSEGTKSSPTLDHDGRILGTFSWQGFDGVTPGAFSSAATLRALTVEDWSSTNHGTAISLSTTASESTSAPTERMRIQSGVSIGSTTDPGAGNLSVIGSITAGSIPSPGPIGGTTPAAITGTTIIGTTITATGNISAANLSSGVYTPTLTNVSGISSSYPYSGHYQRVDNEVKVNGKINATTSTNGANEVDISLPVASNVSGATDCFGTVIGGSGTTGTQIFGNVSCDSANHRAKILFYNSIGVGGLDIHFEFMYTVN